MLQVEGLTIEVDEAGWRVQDEDGRYFTIDSDGNPSADWFCSFEVIKRIQSILQANKELFGAE